MNARLPIVENMEDGRPMAFFSQTSPWGGLYDPFQVTMGLATREFITMLFSPQGDQLLFWTPALPSAWKSQNHAEASPNLRQKKPKE